MLSFVATDVDLIIHIVIFVATCGGGAVLDGIILKSVSKVSSTCIYSLESRGNDCRNAFYYNTVQYNSANYRLWHTIN